MINKKLVDTFVYVQTSDFGIRRAKVVGITEKQYRVQVQTVGTKYERDAEGEIVKRLVSPEDLFETKPESAKPTKVSKTNTYVLNVNGEATTEGANYKTTMAAFKEAKENGNVGDVIEIVKIKDTKGNELDEPTVSRSFTIEAPEATEATDEAPETTEEEVADEIVAEETTETEETHEEEAVNEENEEATE